MKTDYWAVRDRILKAVAENNDKALRDLAAQHPKIFKELENQAKNSLNKGWHIEKPPKENYDS
jgi:ribosomal protein L20